MYMQCTPTPVCRESLDFKLSIYFALALRQGIFWHPLRAVWTASYRRSGSDGFVLEVQRQPGVCTGNRMTSSSYRTQQKMHKY